MLFVELCREFLDRCRTRLLHCTHVLYAGTHSVRCKNSVREAGTNVHVRSALVTCREEIRDLLAGRCPSSASQRFWA
jgi:hypothetical protein